MLQLAMTGAALEGYATAVRQLVSVKKVALSLVTVVKTSMLYVSN